VVGGKLSTQLEQQGGSVAKLDEATKQADGQIRTLSPRVDQLKTSLADLAKVLHTLTERSAESDRRVTGLAGQIEEKVGALAVQEAERSAKLEKLAKRLDLEGQAVTGHLNIVTQNMNAVAKSVETLQGKVGDIQGRVGDLTSRNPGETEARLEALNKSLNATMTTVNETTRAVGDLKQVLEVSVGKLASRVDEHGDALNKLAQQLQNPRTVSSVQGATPGPEAQPNASSAEKPATQPGAAPDSVYEHAYQEFQQGQYENALASFRSFLKQYPDSTLVPNAHFWIAESYVKKRDYQRSLNAYEEVIQNHPRSGKASIALYRKALVLLELNDRPAAKTALKKLIADYPKSEESKQARTKLASLQ
jgi:tol-pal system protein YbgF